MTFREVFMRVLNATDPAVKTVNTANIEASYNGHNTHINRPRRQIFNLEVAQTIKKGSNHAARNRVVVPDSARIKNNDIA